MTGNFEDPRKVFGAAVSEIAQQNPEIVLLSADSGKSSGFQPFKTICREAPKRTLPKLFFYIKPLPFYLFGLA